MLFLLYFQLIGIQIQNELNEDMTDVSVSVCPCVFVYVKSLYDAVAFVISLEHKINS